MSWQILILINVLLYSVSVILQRTIIKNKESDPWAYSIMFQFIVGVMIWIYTYFTMGTNIHMDIPFYHPNLVLMTLLWGGANIFIYNALKVSEASTFTIIFATRSLFTLMASTIFLREFVSPTQLFGILSIVVGVIVVSYKKKGLSFGKKELFSFGAAVFVGLANTNDRAVLKLLDVQTYSVISYLFPAFFLLVLRPKTISKLKTMMDKTTIKNTLLLAIFWVGFSLTFNQALKIAPSASQVSAISLTSVILIVLLSVVFLKEKDNLAKKIIGAIVSFIGLLLVS
jgi:drug/metabolite transporter (DMT)-like permease